MLHKPWINKLLEIYSNGQDSTDEIPNALPALKEYAFIFGTPILTNAHTQIVACF